MTDTWKLHVQGSVLRAGPPGAGGKPQQVTIHGREAVVVVDPERFEIRAKPKREETLAGFVERSKRYRGTALNVKRFKMKFPLKYAFRSARTSGEMVIGHERRIRKCSPSPK